MFLSYNRLPGLSDLAKDYFLSYEKVQIFYAGDYRDKHQVEKVATQVQKAARADRKKVIEILIDQNQSFYCGQKTSENLERLKNDDALAVVTGQQVGLFGGPLYTLYKAFTTVKLAQSLSEKLNVPVVPVFYLVSEDHDFAEVQWCGFIDLQNHFAKISFVPAKTYGKRTPVSEIILEKHIHNLIEEITSKTPDTEFKIPVIEELKKCYAPNVSFAHAFARWFSKLLTEYGVIFLDAMDSRFKHMVAHVYEQELRENLSTKPILAANDQLIAHGYHTQLSVHRQRPHVFILRHGRHSLEKTEGGYRNLSTGEVLSEDDLLAHPEQLSPKAALRPVVQDTLLPTIAYVGGPAEIAYWGQLKGVYEAFSLPMPVVVPRAGFTLVEPKIRRHLHKFNLSLESFLSEGESALRQVHNAIVPGDIRNMINNLKQTWNSQWQQLRTRVLQIEQTLQGPLDKTENQISGGIAQLEQKITRAIQDRDKIMTEQLQATREHLMPADTLQERKLNATPFLFKYNWNFMDIIYHAIDIERLEHQIVEL